MTWLDAGIPSDHEATAMEVREIEMVPRMVMRRVPARTSEEQNQLVNAAALARMQREYGQYNYPPRDPMAQGSGLGLTGLFGRFWP